MVAMLFCYLVDSEIEIWPLGLATRNMKLILGLALFALCDVSLFLYYP